MGGGRIYSMGLPGNHSPHLFSNITLTVVVRQLSYVQRVAVPIQKGRSHDTRCGRIATLNMIEWPLFKGVANLFKGGGRVATPYLCRGVAVRAPSNITKGMVVQPHLFVQMFKGGGCATTLICSER